MNDDTPSPQPAYDGSSPSLPETSAFATEAAPEPVAPSAEESGSTAYVAPRGSADGDFTAACSEWVRAKPITAMAVAFGAGLLLGRIGR